MVFRIKSLGDKFIVFSLGEASGVAIFFATLRSGLSHIIGRVGILLAHFNSFAMFKIALFMSSLIVKEGTVVDGSFVRIATRSSVVCLRKSSIITEVNGVCFGKNSRVHSCFCSRYIALNTAVVIKC